MLKEDNLTITQQDRASLVANFNDLYSPQGIMASPLRHKILDPLAMAIYTIRLGKEGGIYIFHIKRFTAHIYFQALFFTYSAYHRPCHD